MGVRQCYGQRRSDLGLWVYNWITVGVVVYKENKENKEYPIYGVVLDVENGGWKNLWNWKTGELVSWVKLFDRILTERTMK